MEENQQGELRRHSKTYKFMMEKHSHLGTILSSLVEDFFMQGENYSMRSN